MRAFGSVLLTLLPWGGGSELAATGPRGPGPDLRDRHGPHGAQESVLRRRPPTGPGGTRFTDTIAPRAPPADNRGAIQPVANCGASVASVAPAEAPRRPDGSRRRLFPLTDREVAMKKPAGDRRAK